MALDLAPPAGAVDWGDLAGLRFAEPFFDQTVERWAGGGAASLDEEEEARLLRLLVRALSRRRFGDERHYVLKLSSWNVARFALFRRALPAAKPIWVQRAPLEVLASVMADPPGWSEPRRAPALVERLFGIPAEELAPLDAERLDARRKRD